MAKMCDFVFDCMWYMPSTKYIDIRGLEEQIKSLAISGLAWACCQNQAPAGFPSKKESPSSLKIWICGAQN